MKLLRIVLPLLIVCISYHPAHCWGFWAHKKINYYACFLLPPQMMKLYKPNIDFLAEHSTDPDKRRYAVKDEGPRHYIDLNDYGTYPFDSLPRTWNAAVEKFGEEEVKSHGIVPWHIQVMLSRLTYAFKDKNFSQIMKYSAEIGHYIADSHVPLHASNNHNGEKTNQKGIHGFWESRIPELLAEKNFNFFVGKAKYLKDPLGYTWERVLESGRMADSVLLFERQLTDQFPDDQKYSFENRNGVLIRQYSSAFTIAYDKKLDGMVELRMRQSIEAIASFWFTAWVNAGQPDLSSLTKRKFSEAEIKEFEDLNKTWNSGGKMIGRDE